MAGATCIACHSEVDSNYFCAIPIFGKIRLVCFDCLRSLVSEYFEEHLLDDDHD
ncbi:MAG: hypothetical protein QXI92_02495 [Candidatus Nitrosocaldus sp.]